MELVMGNYETDDGRRSIDIVDYSWVMLLHQVLEIGDV